jgi:hypothetical protein
MADPIEFVQLEPNEDATSVRDRLSFFRGQRVLLIWPEEGTALNRKLDLVLVQREAMRRAIRLAVVTHDPEVIEYAQELNVSTFETIGASQRGRWKRGRSKVFTSRSQKPEDEPEHEELMPVASRVRVTPRVSVSRFLRGLIILALLGALGAVLGLVFPSATVTFDLAEETINVSSTIIASPSAGSTDIENGIIPARLLKIDITQTGSRPTSGTQSLSPTPASGFVWFINQSGDAIEIPTGTIVSTSGGAPIRYRTTESVTLAAGAENYVEVRIEALPEFAGLIGNVDVNVINTVEEDWSDQVIVINPSPMTGGEDRNLPVVTETDRERLLAAVRQLIQNQALEEFQAQLAEHEILILETLGLAPESNRADWQTFTAETGAYEASIGLTLRAIVQVVVIDERRAHEVVFARMGAEIPPGRSILPNTLEYTNGPVTNIDDEGQVTFSVTGVGQVAGQINTGALQERLAGQTIEEAQTYLTSTLDLAPDTTPQITVSPDFLGRLPFLPIRINVRVVEGE